jgi:hypothetical protein
MARKKGWCPQISRSLNVVSGDCRLFYCARANLTLAAFQELEPRAVLGLELPHSSAAACSRGSTFIGPKQVSGKNCEVPTWWSLGRGQSTNPLSWEKALEK